ncbi:MAG: filamentous hemagglutinin N-terminal domain-containing protein [Desulfuromonadales bacterium]|nr:filamentous hemagglutinin N-terminal domain-containing protein [Desulfuromonadales bacterium]
MNKIFRSIWSDALGTFVAVAEIVSTHGRGSGKRGRLRLLAASLLLTLWICGGTAVADILPTGGHIVAGSGSIATSGNTMTVTQDTQRMAADWTSFSIGQNNAVNFNQPSSSAVALNRVTGADASVIQGALNANGQVFLVNPSGVLFSSTAQVNVGALVASTLNLTNDDFMAGNDRFAGNSSNAIVNQGNITTHDGGTIALIAARIDNSGTLTANGGNVLMGAGSKVTLDLGGPVKIQVEEAAIDALIEQGGAIKADGGLVYLTARAAGELSSTVINHTGITQAQTLATGESGEIFLMVDMDNGRIVVAGTLDASAPNGGDGGFVETSAASVHIKPDLIVTTNAEDGKTGEWLIDPNDYKIAATGGDITGAQLSSNLGTTNVTIQSVDGANASGNGDIFVNDGITWQSGNKLTLNAMRNIEINATIDARQGSGGKLALEYGQGAVASANTAYYLINAPVSLQASGAANGINGANPTNFSTKLGSNGIAVNYTTITNNTGTALNTQLSNNLGGNFALSTDITLTGTSNWTPIGNETNKFTGRFEGLGHTIDGLNIPGTASYVGLFSHLNNAYIGNIHLSNASVAGAKYVGALVGVSGPSLIVNASSSGSVKGYVVTNIRAQYIGGLVGVNNGKIIFSHSGAEVSLGLNGMLDTAGGLVGYSSGTIENSYATGKVSGGDMLGGLVGVNDPTGIIKNSYATGEVAGNRYIGGLVGNAFPPITGSAIIENSYATGKVTGAQYVGGFVGNNNATINNSYATGDVAGTGTVGGFVATNKGTINNSYATGEVAGTDGVGGFVGENYLTGVVNNSYATGLVTGTTNYVGGFAGSNYKSGGINNSFWDTQSSGQPTKGAGFATSPTLIGKNTAQMVNQSTFTNAGWLTSIWSFTDVTADNALEGYGVSGKLPYLNDVTRAEDITTRFGTLFEGGKGIDSNPYTITNWTQLQNINHNSDVLSNNYYFTLSNSIDNTTTGYTALASSSANDAAGWIPIGTGELQFRGNFDGSSHTITGLVINRPTTDYIGLFGATNGATIQNVGIVDANITGKNRVGGLAGYAVTTTIANSYATGKVTSSGNFVGGLVGEAKSATIKNSYAKGDVVGSDRVGGLVGHAYNTSAITNSYATGGVEGRYDVGGLAGEAASTSITNSHATGDVEGKNRVGGLVGTNYFGTIANAYAVSTVTGDYGVGGLVGNNIGTISQAYAKGTVTGVDQVGGLVGNNAISISNAYADSAVIGERFVGGLVGEDAGGTISNAYAVGTVTGVSYLGGLIGMADNSTTIANSFWDTQTSGLATSAGGVGKTTKEMQSLATFQISDGVWDIQQDTSYSKIYPFLAFTDDGTGGYTATWVIGKYSTALNYTLSDVGADNSILYKGDNYLLSSYWTNSIFGDEGDALLLGTDYNFTYNNDTVTGFTNAGTYNGITVTLLNPDYELGGTGNTAGSFKITPAPLTVTANSDTLTYNGLEQSVTGFTVNGLVNNEVASVLTGVSTSGGTGTNADSYTHTASGTTQNYTLTFVDGTLTIAPRPITIVADGKSKVYGNADPTLTWQITNGNLVGSDTLSGVLTRTAGENVGSYTIDASALANGNYLITANNGELTITPRPITIAADDKSKVYGNADPTLTWQITNGNLVGSDTLSGVLTRTAGENVGSYSIDASALANGNYLITANDGALTITARPITVAAEDKNKIYGNDDPTLSWQVTTGNLVGEDTLGGVLTRTAGENVGSYSIDASALANGNYLITAKDGALTITARPITITADDKSKQQGQSDPALTFQTEAQSSDRGLVSGDSISGSLIREAGEGTGSYAIEQGSVTNTSNPNYDISYVGADLTIAAVSDDPVVPPPFNEQQQAAIVNAQNLAHQMVNGFTGDTSTPTGAPTALTTPLQAPTVGDDSPSTGISGGLHFVEVEDDIVGDGDIPARTATGSQPGRDTSGFMNVFVVRGGINYGTFK